ncbi:MULTISPECIES: ABC transporter permease [Alicyclobacillus]|uniref:ABC transporter permease n=1 Tax=Alicyclobacillus acidoterrestris (strain ATCC 49025 / DSM 3922 / CIP 106132 / NCIMB 13137 / GD3B) TaxID=1356854 RepID=T0BJL4_ALIAG|nr:MULTISPECIES: ABC transporter permease [Alicyclobacillus]EPZ44158.1 branched-chain amino acid ABC transporter permease [Alicyclobacillus acidoterrestris ATCC 49025]UNO49675.1 ABC transporter permease [Alicyclobacillus acidoterrestris]
MSIFADAQIWSSTLSMAVPLALPAIGGTFSERTGVVNVAMEGIMLMGAFFGVAFSYWTGNAWIGLLMALIIGGLTSAAFAWGAIRVSADQVVLGMAINIFAAGLTAFLLDTVFGFSGTPPTTPKLPNVSLPGIDKIPYVGQIFTNQSILVYVMIVIVILSHWFLFHTRLGLRMRSVGENPLAADTVGINVWRLRYAGVIIGGLLSALGGAYLSIGVLNSFSVNMTNGRGYIALAAMIFGKWTPLGSFGAALLFGFSTALGIVLQGNGVSSNLLQMIPYALTIIALTGLVGRSTPPAADGVPYDPKR